MTELNQNNLDAFVASLALVQKRTHQINRDNGFWDVLDRVAAQGEQEKVLVIASRIGLIHSEPSEALEAARKHPPESWPTMEKDSLARELGGTVVRIMDLAEWLKIDLGEAILAELANNATRGHLHGGKKA